METDVDAFPLGVNGTSSHLVFIGDLTQTSAKLKSMPITGGTAKTLGDSVGALLASVETLTAVPQAHGSERRSVSLKGIVAPVEVISIDWRRSAEG